MGGGCRQRTQKICHIDGVRFYGQRGAPWRWSNVIEISIYRDGKAVKLPCPVPQFRSATAECGCGEKFTGLLDLKFKQRPDKACKKRESGPDQTRKVDPARTVAEQVSKEFPFHCPTGQRR